MNEKKLSYATPSRTSPAARFNKLDFLQIAIVFVVVLLGTALWWFRLRRW